MAQLLPIVKFGGCCQILHHDGIFILFSFFFFYKRNMRLMCVCVCMYVYTILRIITLMTESHAHALTQNTTNTKKEQAPDKKHIRISIPTVTPRPCDYVSTDFPRQF